MYPSLYEMFQDLFGLELGFLSIVQTFGFFVAMAFVAAAYVLAFELKRKEKEGWIKGEQVQVWIGKAARWDELLTNALVGFLFGWKVIPLVFNNSAVQANPQAYIFSFEGNVIWGIVLAVALAVWKYYEKHKKKLPKPKLETVTIHPYQRIGDITIWAMISGLLGAKIFHNLENPQEFMADPIDALFSLSGLTFYGGLLCGAAGVLYYTTKKKIGHWHVLDSAAPALMLAYGVGRIGCQLAGDGDWGIPNDAPMPDWLSFLPSWVWAYDYPNNVLGINLMQDFQNQGYTSITGKAWPTPLYEAVSGISLFVVLWVMRKKIKTPGVIFGVYLIFNGIERFLIEKIRVNPDYNIFGLHVTQAEIISTALVLTGVIGIIWLRKYHQNTPPPEPLPDAPKEGKGADAKPSPKAPAKKG